MNSQATDPPMIEALEGASSLQLYQLKALIEGMLADPRRGMAARASLHLGQAVQFVDFRDGQMRRGKIIAMRDTQATVLELEGTKRTWKLPCLAMQGYTAADRRRERSVPYEPPPEPVAAATKAREFQRGDTVTFEDRDGQRHHWRDRAHQPTHRHDRHRHRRRWNAGACRSTCCGTCSTSEHRRPSCIGRRQEGLEAALTSVPARVRRQGCRQAFRGEPQRRFLGDLLVRFISSEHNVWPNVNGKPCLQTSQRARC